MKDKHSILWITRTAIIIALLIVLQAVTAPLGNTLITGSLVNMLLVVAVMTCGLVSGLAAAVVSPFMAKLVGIGPLWSLIPIVAAGNMVLVLLWYLIAGKAGKKEYWHYAAAWLGAAAAKFLVLYIGVVKIAVPLFLQLPQPQAAVISTMFSFPQLVTALIGGAIAVVIFPRLRTVIKGGNVAQQ